MATAGRGKGEALLRDVRVHGTSIFRSRPEILLRRGMILRFLLSLARATVPRINPLVSSLAPRMCVMHNSMISDKVAGWFWSLDQRKICYMWCIMHLLYLEFKTMIGHGCFRVSSSVINTGNSERWLSVGDVRSDCIEDMILIQRK